MNANGNGNGNGPLLVVEDEAIIAMDIRSELQSRGWTVGTLAGSEAKALAAIAVHDFAGAVLDINLGAMTSGARSPNAASRSYS